MSIIQDCHTTKNGDGTDHEVEKCSKREQIPCNRHGDADLQEQRFVPCFNFGHLTHLALHGLRFEPPDSPAQAPSIYLCPLVLLLKNAKQLRCLELSTVNERGWGAYSNEWAQMPGDEAALHHMKMMRTLCHDYKDAGGSPLQHLQYLRLGPGCALTGRYTGNIIPDEGPSDYLGFLFKLSCLVELHLEYCPDLNWTKRNILTLVSMIHPSRLPNLRKLSLPYNMWAWWPSTTNSFWWPRVIHDPETLATGLPYTVGQGLTLRIVGYTTESRNLNVGDRLPRLSGLVLPTSSMNLERRREIATLRCWKDLKSFKILLPRLCEVTCGGPTPPRHEQAPEGKSPRTAEDDDDGLASIQWGINSFCEALGEDNKTKLRELWLFGDVPSTGNVVMDGASSSHKAQIKHFYLYHVNHIEHIARSLFSRFPRLEYVHILHRAWRRGRARKDFTGDDDEMLGGPVRELTKWEVENDLPEAFDFRTPSIFRGRQFE